MIANKENSKLKLANESQKDSYRRAKREISILKEKLDG